MELYVPNPCELSLGTEAILLLRDALCSLAVSIRHSEHVKCLCLFTLPLEGKSVKATSDSTSHGSNTYFLAKKGCRPPSCRVDFLKLSPKY